MIRILLADDDTKVRAVIRMILEEAGFEVVEAKDGKEALRAFRSERADVIVCDVFMPDKDGLEAIKELRGEFPGVKIVAMSGGGSKGTSDGILDMLMMARHLGAAEVLSKPIDQASLLAAIRRLLGTPPEVRPSPLAG
jgi:CheY-like chemotaxis protein